MHLLILSWHISHGRRKFLALVGLIELLGYALRDARLLGKRSVVSGVGHEASLLVGSARHFMSQSLDGL